MITPEECVARGGHCWHHSYDFPAFAILPPPPPSWLEECKHCPTERHATSREPVEYGPVTVREP